MAKLALPYPIPAAWSPATAQAIEDNFRRLFGSSGRLGSGGTTFINGLNLIAPAAGDMIVCLVGGTFVSLPIVATVQLVLTNNGGTPTWAALDLANGVTGRLPFSHLTQGAALSVLGVAANAPADVASIAATVDGQVLTRAAGALLFAAPAAPAAGSITLAMLADLATQHLIGRNTAGTGVPEAVTLTQLLDWIGSAAQGDVLVRGAASWQRLAAGALGTFLGGNGAGADLSYQTPTGAGSIVDLIQQQSYEVHGRPTTLVVMGLPALATAGSIGSTQLTTTAGSTVQLIQTGSTIDLRCGFDSGRFDMHELDSGITFEVVLKTGATMTNIRMWIALSAAAMSTSADDEGGTSKYVAFRYSTVAGDGGWVGVARDGTTQHVTGTVAAIAPSTVYKLKIRISGSTAFFSVNGGAETSTASNLPAAGTQLGFSLQVFNAAGGATHPWEFSRLRGYYGA